MSNLKVNTINDANGGSAAVLYGVASPPNSMGFRNRIINGDMRIDQRNAGASVTPAAINASVYFLDRWSFYNTVASRLTYQQSNSVFPAGYAQSMAVSVASAHSPTGSDAFSIEQPIEAFNVSDFSFGTAAAVSITISFWVRSSLTGAFGGAVKNSASNRSYPFTYTVSAANTWEQKAVTIPGDTTGSWISGTNGIGLRLVFDTGCAGQRSTANSWQAGNLNGVTGTVQLVANAGATFYITGVQLEAGTVATPFERRDYGRELMMCQRYYYEGVAVTGTAANTTGINGAIASPVEMRATPSVNKTAGTFTFGDLVAAGFTSTDTPVLQDVLLTQLNKLYRFRLNGFTGLTQYRTYAHEPKSSTPAQITLSAEL